MTDWRIWDDVREELADALGSPEERAQRAEQLRRELALQRLVEMRKRAGLRQVDVADRMGVSKARVSHIEHGAVATIELLARYLDAIGGAAGDHCGVRRRLRTCGPRLAGSLSLDSLLDALTLLTNSVRAGWSGRRGLDGSAALRVLTGFACCACLRAAPGGRLRRAGRS